MFKKLRSLTIAAAILASLMLGATTAQAGGSPKPSNQIPSATAADISWE